MFLMGKLTIIVTFNNTTFVINVAMQSAQEKHILLDLNVTYLKYANENVS